MIVRLLRKMEGFFDEPKTTALQDAAAGLADAEKQALTEQSMAEYAAAQVICHRAMAEYQQKRAARLAAYIHEKTDGNPALE